MSSPEVQLTIDGRAVRAPAGTLLVDAAKRAEINIPVFCYHPKLEPVGMCRMCLVEIGRPERDKATGDWARDGEGRPRIRFGGKLETACTTPVGEGWDVRVGSDLARAGRKEIVEFLLTSHPLDCPVCDKGGECPLQDLTMDHGPGKSRFLFEDKIDLAKHLALGELIYLDRERCIQCARCTRFQDEIAGEPVIGFELRGRALQIVTYSDPGFDSYFSGNTTDICPVGALTTADFRFEARPWELKTSASVCPHCPVGCNLTLQVRRQPLAEGRITVQRVLPRQNESVNEIWICDKGRFGHHFAESPERITRPLVRKDEELVETDWDEALDRAAEGLKSAGGEIVGLAGGRASLEDLFHFRRLLEGLGGTAALSEEMGGGETVGLAGVPPGTDLGRLGQGDAILVIAADLQEEAPVWWLRLKQAADRGAELVVANARPTKLDDHARRIVRFRYGETLDVARYLSRAPEARGEAGGPGANAKSEAADLLSNAGNLLIFFGSDGLSLDESEELARICGQWLQDSGRVGKPQNGLVGIWPHANTQGGFEIGLRPFQGDRAQALGAKAVYLMASDPAGDDPAWSRALDTANFVIVQELFLTESARKADVVFPAQSFVEREGSYVSGERRVQRMYPAVPARGEAREDWRILAELGRRLGVEMEAGSAAALLRQIGVEIPVFEGVDYQALSQGERQWPPVGGRDLYFGGTATPSGLGVGVSLPLWPGAIAQAGTGDAGRGGGPDQIWLVPVHRLYDRAITLRPSRILQTRLAEAGVMFHPEDGRRLGVAAGAEVELRSNGTAVRVRATLSEAAPLGAVLAPHSVGLPFPRPAPVEIQGVGEG